MVEVGADPTPYGYAATCSVHGLLHYWPSPLAAAWDAIGHASAHHSGGSTDGR